MSRPEGRVERSTSGGSPCAGASLPIGQRGVQNSSRVAAPASTADHRLVVREPGEGSRRELGRHRRPRHAVAVAGEHHGEVTDPRVVPDEQYARDRRRHGGGRGRAARRCRPRRAVRRPSMDVSAGSAGRIRCSVSTVRAADEHSTRSGGSAEALEVLAESGCGAAPPWRERTVVVGDVGLVPARLGVAQPGAGGGRSPSPHRGPSSVAVRDRDQRGTATPTSV